MTSTSTQTLVVGGRARTPTTLARYALGRGVVALTAGALVLAWPSSWLVSVSVVLGAAAAAVGLVDLTEAARRRRLAVEAVLPTLRGVVAVAGGAYPVARSSLDLDQLAVVVGGLWALYGLGEAVEGLLALRAPLDGPWRVIRGVVVGGAALAVLLWPSITVTGLVRLVGALLVVAGLLCLVSARVLHRAGRTTRDVRLDVVLPEP